MEIWELFVRLAARLPEGSWDNLDEELACASAPSAVTCADLAHAPNSQAPGLGWGISTEHPHTLGATETLRKS